MTDLEILIEKDKIRDQIYTYWTGLILIWDIRFLPRIRKWTMVPPTREPAEASLI